MKILHIDIVWQNQRQFAQMRMLESLGEYKQFDFIAETKRHGTGGMNRNLVKLAKEYNPDITFMQHAGDVTNETIKQIPGKVFAWVGDIRNPIQDWAVRQAKAVACTMYSNMRDVKILQSMGLNAEYLQIGFDEQIFYPKEVEKSIDVIFAANNYGGFPLSKYRTDAVEIIHKSKHRLSVFGGSFDRKFNPGDTNGNLNAERENYWKSKIGLSISHDCEERYYSDRLLRTMASGCFCLSHRFPGVELEFMPGEHLVLFDSLDEMMEKIQYYLDNDEERERIAKLGCAHVHSSHRWIDRAKDFQAIIEKYA